MVPRPTADEEVALRAVREQWSPGEHKARVAAAARRVRDAHEDALDRLGR
jgi:hypothetical protein